ncbi:MAG: TIGR04372 family glycosyltransferase, partial [Planctomycetales bacterium]
MTGIHKAFQAARELFRAGASVCRLILPTLFWPVFWLLDAKFIQFEYRRIGHLAVEPDYFLKAAELDGAKQHRFRIVLAPGADVANHWLLDYWKSYFVIVTSRWLCRLLRPLARGPLMIDARRTKDGPILGTDPTYALHARWGNRAPLLQLTEDDQAWGRRQLSAMGIPDDAWFVCVHCREEGYAPNERFANRNGAVADYEEAIRAVAARGGWCARVGDSTMTPLNPDLPNTVDYAVSSWKSERLDVFLCAACRFFLGNTSGLFLASTVFGRPCALVNVTPAAAAALNASDLSIPKLVRRGADGKLLTFKQ